MDLKFTALLFLAAGMGIAGGFLLSARQNNVIGAYSYVAPKIAPAQILVPDVAGIFTSAEGNDLSLIETGIMKLKAQIESLSAQISFFKSQNSVDSASDVTVVPDGQGDSELFRRIVLLERQLDSDRDHYSLGLDNGTSKDLELDTVDIANGEFNVDDEGNVETAGLTVGGDFVVGGGDPALGKVLTSDANGLATWQTPAEGVTIHSLLSGLDYASSGHTGFEPTVTKGNLAETGSDILTITGGAGSVIGSGATIQVRQADTSHAGYLSSTDWNTFNAKQNTLTADVDYLTPETASSTYQVAGDYLTNISEFTSDDLAQGSTNLYSQWDTAGSDIYYSGGSVGIGVTGSTAKFAIKTEDYIAPTSEIVETQAGSSTFAVSGTAQNWRADDQSYSYTLPFSFPFYGSAVTDVKVSTNGYIWMSTSSDSLPCPFCYQGKPVVAPLTGDWRTNGSGQSGEDIYIDESVPDQVTITWRGEFYSSPGNILNFSTTLHSNGDIDFKYGSGNTGVGGALIAISSGDSENYQMSSIYGQNNLTDAGDVNIAREEYGGTELVTAMHIGSEDADYLTVQNNGYVGIGTSSPLAKLTIKNPNDPTATQEELVVNGAFGTDLSGWTAGAGWSQGSGKAVATETQNDLSQVINIPSAGFYQLDLTIAQTTGFVQVNFCGSGEGPVNGNYTHYYYCNSGNNTLLIDPDYENMNGTVDNVSVKKVDETESAFTLLDGDNAVALEMRGGYESVFIGKNAGKSAVYNSDGGQNTAIGSNALASYIYSYYDGGNTAFGANALKNNIRGAANVALGANAFYNLGNSSSATPNYNTAIGFNAGYSGTSYSGNTLIGYGSGYGLTTGGNNISIGYYAGDNLSSGSNNIIIGHDINAATSSSNNTLNIGNLIFGTGIDGTGTTISTGNIGIGTVVPNYKLDINGTLNVSDDALFSGIGIGTNSPSGVFQIGGANSQTVCHNVCVPEYAGYSDRNIGYKFTANADGNITKLWIKTYYAGNYTVRLYNSAGTVLASAVITAVNDTWVSADISPVAVTAGNWYFISQRVVSGYSPSYYYDYLALPVTSGNITINESRYVTASDAMPTSNIYTDRIYGLVDMTFVADSGAENTMIIDDEANVGIGTTAPTRKLDVVGTANISATSTFESSVGIGTTAPGKKLEMSASVSAAAGVESSTIMRLLNTNTDYSGSNYNQIGIGFGASTTRQAIIGGTYGNDYLDFYTSAEFTAPKVRFDASGNVGIGTTTPLSKLHVEGSNAGGTATDPASFIAYINNTNNGANANGMLVNLTTGSPGSNNQWIEFTANGVEKGAIEGNGGNVNYYSTSDRRLKNNITDTAYSLDDLMKIQVRDFVWNDSGIASTGFIAQELYGIYPAAVYKGDDGETVVGAWKVDYGKLTPLLVKAVQDQQSQIDGLKLVLNPDGSLESNSTSTTGIAQGNSGFFTFVKNALASLGLALQDGVARLTEIFADKVNTKNMTTEQMCISGDDGETVCVDKDQLKSLLETAGVPKTTIQVYNNESEKTDSGSSTSTLPVEEESQDNENIEIIK